MTKEALKLALEALESSVDLVVADAYNAKQLYGNYPTRQGKVGGLKVLAEQHKQAIIAIKEALAQPEQKLWAVARVDDLERAGRVRALAMGLGLDVPLYAAPPQRTWVGLTDEEIRLQWSAFWEAECHPWVIDFAQAIEAKLRSKNNG